MFQLKLQAFAYGAALMGIGGALYAFAKHSITPQAFEPFFATFIIWAMLILGGSGNHRGAILGAFVLWAVISSSQFLPGFLGDPNLRLAVIGLIIVVVLLVRPAVSFLRRGLGRKRWLALARLNSGRFTVVFN